jgi:hypothetical protein
MRFINRAWGTFGGATGGALAKSAAFLAYAFDSSSTLPAAFTQLDGAGTPPNASALYDGPATGTGTNPYPVTTTDASGGTLFGVVLGNNLARCYIFEM